MAYHRNHAQEKTTATRGRSTFLLLACFLCNLCTDLPQANRKCQEVVGYLEGEHKVVSGFIIHNYCYKPCRIQRIALLNLAMGFVTSPLQINTFLRDS